MSSSPRRQPLSGRGRQTREKILATTARLLETMPAAQITTNLIAERAGVSIGSLYQYFTDKDELFVTLATEFGAGLEEFFRKTLAQDDKDLEGVIRDILVGGLALNESAPGVKNLLAAPYPGQDFFAAVEAANQAVLGQVAAFILKRSGGAPSPERAALTAYVSFQLFKSLFAARAEFPAFRDRLVEEYHALLVGYWRSSLERS